MVIVEALKKKDVKKAIQYAIRGMHFDWYLRSGLLQSMYGRYFWYLEMGRATQVIVAYDGNHLGGILLARMENEPKQKQPVLQKLYVRLFDWIQNFLYPHGVGLYDETNRDLFQQYLRKYQPDGEIIFLAADPDQQRKGIGTLLLSELARREQGKEVFLYTDSGCNVQFYEHRGFEKMAEKEIQMDLGKKQVPLVCMLYRTKLSL